MPGHFSWSAFLADEDRFSFHYANGPFEFSCFDGDDKVPGPYLRAFTPFGRLDAILGREPAEGRGCCQNGVRLLQEQALRGPVVIKVVPTGADYQAHFEKLEDGAWKPILECAPPAVM